MNDNIITGEEPEFFAPVAADLIDGLLGQYQHMRGKVERVAAIMNGPDLDGALHYFAEYAWKNDRHLSAATVSSMFKLDGAIAHLNAAYWSKAMHLTDVLDAMPQARRDALESLETRLDARLDELDSQLASIDSRATHSPTLESCALHRGRLETVERLLAEMPGHEAMARVHSRIDEVSALASEVRGRLSGIERTLDTISQHLLEQSRYRD